MTDELKQKIRDAMADNYLGNNRDFRRQLRHGEQDEGPLMKSAFLGAQVALETAEAAQG